MRINFGKNMFLFIFFTCSAALFARGSNLLEDNTGFEVGLGGWVVESVRLVNDLGNHDGWGMDTNAAAEGSHSLRVDCRNEKYVFRLISKTVKCEAGEKYTVSFYAKADRPGITLSSRFGPLFRAVTSGGASLTSEWQRFSYAGIVPTEPEKYRRGIFDLWIQASSDQPVPYTFWLDAIQFEKGDLSAYAPARPVEAGFTTDVFANLYEAGKPAEMILNLYGANAGFTGQATVELEDFYFGRIVQKSSHRLDFQKSSHLSIPLKIPALPRGSYKFRAVIKDDKGTEVVTREVLFATIVKSRNVEFDAASFFGTHVNLYYHSPRIPKVCTLRAKSGSN